MSETSTRIWKIIAEEIFGAAPPMYYLTPEDDILITSATDRIIALLEAKPATSEPADKVAK
jgi:hypothetical protein